MAPHGRSTRIALGAAFLLYTAAWVLLPHNGLFINDNGCKWIQAEGLIRNGYADASVPWPGKDLDPDLQFPPLGFPFGKMIGGRLYASFSMPFALATSIPLRLFGPGGLTLLPFLSGLLLLPAVAALARLAGAGEWGTGLAVGGVALGTPLWFYACALWEHMPAVCLLAWGLVILLRALQEDRRGAAIVGVLLWGLAACLRDDLVLLAPALVAVPLVLRSRWLQAPLVLPAIFLLSLVPLAMAQWAIVGTPFGLHATSHGALEEGFARYLVDRVVVFRDLILDSHEVAWVSLLVSVPCLLVLVARPRPGTGREAPAAAALLAWSTVLGLLALAGHLRSTAPVWYLPSANGLFAVSPFLILSGLRPSAKEDTQDQERVRTALWIVSVLFLGLYAMTAPPLRVRGIHWGARLLLPLFPLLGVLAAAAAGRFIEVSRGRARVRAVALVGAALAVSMAFEIHGLRLLQAEGRFAARLSEAVARHSETVVVTSSWFVPQELAPVFYSRKIFLARTADGMERLMAMLRSRGVSRVLCIDASRTGEREASGAAGAARTPPRGETLGDDAGFMTYTLRTIDLR
jgi:hypothetical protein